MGANTMESTNVHRWLQGFGSGDMTSRPHSVILSTVTTNDSEAVVDTIIIKSGDDSSAVHPSGPTCVISTRLSVFLSLC